MVRHILIADDEPDSADLLGLILSFKGYQVTRVHDGEAALRAIQELVPDLALLDERMPGLFGSEVCRAVRREPATRGCVVVLFSSIDELDVDWAGCGAAAFLQKPIDVRRLPALVERLLGGPDSDDGGDPARPRIASGVRVLQQQRGRRRRPLRDQFRTAPSHDPIRRR